MNVVFKGIVDCHTSIYRFVLQYEKAVESRFDEEDFRTNQVKPSLWSAYPLERHAQVVYPRTMFKEFREHLKLTSYDLKEMETHGTYRLVEIENPEMPNARRSSYVVCVDASSAVASCNCKLFEFSGILCSHVLKVFMQLKIQCIPLPYI